MEFAAAHLNTIESTPVGQKLTMPHPRIAGKSAQYLVAALHPDGRVVSKRAIVNGQVPGNACRAVVCLDTGDAWFAMHLADTRPVVSGQA